MGKRPMQVAILSFRMFFRRYSAIAVVLLHIVGQSQTLRGEPHGRYGHEPTRAMFGEEDTVVRIPSPDRRWEIQIEEKRITCVDPSNKKQLWAVPATSDERVRQHIVTWTSDDEVIVPGNTKLYFVQASTGKRLDSIDFGGYTLQDALAEEPEFEDADTVQAVRFGNILSIPFEDFFDLIDLQQRKLLYRSTFPLGKGRKVICGDIALLAFEGDTNLIVDYRTPRVVARLDVDDDPVNVAYFQPLLVYRDLAYIIREDQISALNLSTGAITSLEISTNKIRNMFMVSVGNKPSMLVQTRKSLYLWNGEQGSLQWEVSNDDVQQGTIVNLRQLNDSLLIVTKQDHVYDISVCGIEIETGKELFCTRLVRATDEWFSYMRHTGGEYQTIRHASTLVQQQPYNPQADPSRPNLPVLNVGGPKYYTGPLRNIRPHIFGKDGFAQLFSPKEFESIVSPSQLDTMNAINDTWIHWVSHHTSMVYLVQASHSTVVLRTAGKVSPAWTTEDVDESKRVAAEFTISIPDGKLLGVTKLPFNSAELTDDDVFSLTGRKRSYLNIMRRDDFRNLVEKLKELRRDR